MAVIGVVRPIQNHCQSIVLTVGGARGRALDLRSTGRGFKSYSRQKLRNNLGQVVHTYVPLSPNSITNRYRSRGGDALRLGSVVGFFRDDSTINVIVVLLLLLGCIAATARCGLLLQTE